MASTIDRHEFELSNGILSCWILELADGSVWFRGNDIAGFLGYRRPQDAITKYVRPEWRKMWEEMKKLLTTPVTSSYLQPKVWMISKEGVRCLLEKTKLPVPKQTIEELARVFDIDLTLPQEPEEMKICITPKPTNELNYISAIREAFYFYKSATQFHIGEYKIDLYFPDQKVAIERYNCNWDLTYTYEREKFIKEQLNCHFLRFIPDEKMFSIFKFIGDINRVFFLDSNYSKPFDSKPNNSNDSLSDSEKSSTHDNSNDSETSSCLSDMITCSFSDSDSGIEA